MAFYSNERKILFGVVYEQQKNLFEVQEEYSLAQCVPKDLKMPRGAIDFEFKFDRTREVYLQHPEVGKTCYLQDQGRFIYYLVTKSQSSEKSRRMVLKS